jgi:glycosyltransferase involved in cell wall biosynthesis
MPIISIIVPIYNVEKYLHRCLDSILMQTFAAFECILVNDCSPDNCSVICDEYVKKDNRFKVIHKKQNEGLPRARKSGLDMANAEFIMHIDSDDWIESNALELLYKKQQETDADIVIGNMNRVYSWGMRTYIYPKIETSPIAYLLLCCHKGMVSKLYRKNITLNYILPETDVEEDFIVNVQIFSKIESGKLQKIDSAIYNYDNTSNGITNNLPKIYKSYMDSPHYKSRLWVKQYLNNMNSDKLIRIGCSYVVYIYIIKFLKDGNCVTKNDIETFYKDYHKEFASSEYRKIIETRQRIIVPIFYFSITLGRVYVKILSILRCIKRFNLKLFKI